MLGHLRSVFIICCKYMVVIGGFTFHLKCKLDIILTFTCYSECESLDYKIFCHFGLTLVMGE